jgi:hypothetical protein
MQNALARALEGLTVLDVERIRTGCGHVRVPSAPAARGYRYIDLAGDEPPFYVRRLRRRGEFEGIGLRGVVGRQRSRAHASVLDSQGWHRKEFPCVSTESAAARHLLSAARSICNLSGVS